MHTTPGPGGQHRMARQSSATAILGVSGHNAGVESVPQHVARGAGAAATPEFAPDPAHGRMFATAQVVRGTDVTPSGRLRLDALARYLQDAAEDDLADAGWDEPYGWLLRRCSVAVRSYPGRGQHVEVRTFCSATGPRWAERTTTLSGAAGDVVQARALWVAVTREDGRPCPLGEAFHRLYGPSAGGRQVSARLSLPVPPHAQAGTPWPLRVADIDLAGHVNNSVHWAAVEDALAGLTGAPVAAELEYHRPIFPGQQPTLVITRVGADIHVWL